MYVVCSEHICQGLRGWAGGAGMGGWRGGLRLLEAQGGQREETERFTQRASYCVCLCVYVYVPLLWQRSLIPCVYGGRISLII